MSFLVFFSLVLVLCRNEHLEYSNLLGKESLPHLYKLEKDNAVHPSIQISKKTEDNFPFSNNFVLYPPNVNSFHLNKVHYGGLPDSYGPPPGGWMIPQGAVPNLPAPKNSGSSIVGFDAAARVHEIDREKNLKDFKSRIHSQAQQAEKGQTNRYTGYPSGPPPPTRHHTENIAPFYAGIEKCADENEHCICNGIVRFGHLKTKMWTDWREVEGGIECQNSIFGNPVREKFKECQCRSLIPQLVPGYQPVYNPYAGYSGMYSPNMYSPPYPGTYSPPYVKLLTSPTNLHQIPLQLNKIHYGGLPENFAAPPSGWQIAPLHPIQSAEQNQKMKENIKNSKTTNRKNDNYIQGFKNPYGRHQGRKVHIENQINKPTAPPQTPNIRYTSYSQAYPYPLTPPASYINPYGAPYSHAASYMNPYGAYGNPPQPQQNLIPYWEKLIPVHESPPGMYNGGGPSSPDQVPPDMGMTDLNTFGGPFGVPYPDEPPGFWGPPPWWEDELNELDMIDVAECQFLNYHECTKWHAEISERKVCLWDYSNHMCGEGGELPPGIGLAPKADDNEPKYHEHKEKYDIAEMEAETNGGALDVDAEGDNESDVVKDAGEANGGQYVKQHTNGAPLTFLQLIINPFRWTSIGQWFWDDNNKEKFISKSHSKSRTKLLKAFSKILPRGFR